MDIVFLRIKKEMAYLILGFFGVKESNDNSSLLDGCKDHVPAYRQRWAATAAETYFKSCVSF